MQLIKKCEKYGNVLFYIAILLNIAVMCEGFSVWESLPAGRMLQVAFVLCVLKIATTYYEKWEWAVMIVLGIIGTLSYCISGEKFMIYLVVLIFAAKAVDAKMVTLLSFDGVWITTILLAIFSLTDNGGTVKMVQEFGRGMVETRYCLGFNHPNNLHGTLWYILCLWIILYKDRNDWRHYLVATIINIVLYVFTVSRTGVVVSELVIIAGFVYTYWNEKVFEKKITYYIGYVLTGIVLVISLLAVTLKVDHYGPILSFINKCANGRLEWANIGANISSWNAFLPGFSNAEQVVDNGFARVPAAYGYVCAIIFVAFFVWAIYKSSVKKTGILLAVILTTVLYTFMESSYTVNDMFLLSNPVVIVAFCYLGRWGNKIKKVETDQVPDLVVQTPNPDVQQKEE